MTYFIVPFIGRTVHVFIPSFRIRPYSLNDVGIGKSEGAELCILIKRAQYS